MSLRLQTSFSLCSWMHLCCGGRLLAQSRAVGRWWEKKSAGTFAICNWKKKAAEWPPLVRLDWLTESKRPIWRSAFPATLRHGDFGAEVDVLNGVEEFYSFDHRTLERFAAGDEAGAAGAFVDDSGSDRFFEIVCAGCAAGVYETGAAHVAIRDLVAAKIGGMIAG